MSLDCLAIEMEKWALFNDSPGEGVYTSHYNYIKSYVFPGLDPVCVDGKRPPHLASLEALRDTYATQWELIAETWCNSAKTEQDRIDRDTAYQQIQAPSAYVSELGYISNGFTQDVSQNCGT